VKLPLPAGQFDAYLFDCDGTIVDSMPLHYVAWKSVLSELSCDFPEDLFYSWGGMPVAEIIATLNRRYNLDMPIQATLHRKEGLFLETLPHLKAIPETVEHIHARHGEIPFAVVSGGTRDAVTASLTTVNLIDRFQTIVCAEDYRNGKPHPEPFLLAADRLGVRPEACLVFEDTDMGIEAATAAGMASVKVPSPSERGVKASMFASIFEPTAIS
jgi:beta-phosphoglucomutase-like phosphatase (HAD superfamily)